MQAVCLLVQNQSLLHKRVRRTDWDNVIRSCLGLCQIHIPPVRVQSFPSCSPCCSIFMFIEGKTTIHVDTTGIFLNRLALWLFLCLGTVWN